MAASKSASKKKIANFDFTLLFIIIFILAFGLVMLYSTSAYSATLKYSDSTYYLKKQLLAAILGFVAMFIISNLNYHLWQKLVFPIYLFSLGLCVAVFFIGSTYNDSTRWIKIGGINFQPSELAKIAVILFIAAFVANSPKFQRRFKNNVITIAFILPFFVVVMVNNLSTAVIILGIAFMMVFISSTRFWGFVGLAGAGVGLIAIYVLVGASYRSGRIDAWLNPEDYITGTGFQILQGLYAIGSGGLFGKGLGEGFQKYIVPEATNDMIFSIICEELGIFGAVCVILMYILLLYRLLYIANHARDTFGAFVCVGVMCHIALQVVLNIAVVTNSIPNTGVTLPLISYGGSSLLMTMCEFGITLNISKYMEFEDTDIDG